ncbi:MAG TPA: DeoR/GlpR transcriptional regulator [Chloroflexi bacterium]|nr:DeoR/GlpR transcriptional regulator [Chloroflexota bacterium]
MGKVHQLAQRRQQILSALGEAGQLSVSKLSAAFDVSEVTIRQDLQALSDQGLLLRTRGGATSTSALPELSFDLRQQQYAAQKARIGQSAAKLVHYGDTIFLDASTTVQTIIPHIKKLSELTVVTNSLRVAFNLLDAPQIYVILPGGSLRRTSISLVGQLQSASIEDINIQIGFFGARGVTANEGLTDVNREEVVMKRAMIKYCKRVIGLADTRKWGKAAAYTFAQLDKIESIFTDTSAPEDLVEEVRQRNVDVVLV